MNIMNLYIHLSSLTSLETLPDVVTCGWSVPRGTKVDSVSPSPGFMTLACYTFWSFICRDPYFLLRTHPSVVWLYMPVML